MIRVPPCNSVAVTVALPDGVRLSTPPQVSLLDGAVHRVINPAKARTAMFHGLPSGTSKVDVVAGGLRIGTAEARIPARGLLSLTVTARAMPCGCLAPVNEADGGSSPPGDRAAQVEAKIRPRLTQELAEIGLRYGDPVFIRIFKRECSLELWVRSSDGQIFGLFRSYKICRLSKRIGPKRKEGDYYSPEGFYRAAYMKSDSIYHLAINVGYPNKYDDAHGYKGGSVMIHGGCFSEGCFAMTDPYIEEIYTLTNAAIRGGQKPVPVHIFPFRMTDSKLSAESSSEWFEFWKQLKPAFDIFSETEVPPHVGVTGGRYVVTAAK